MILGVDALAVEALAATVLRDPPVPVITAPVGTVTSQTTTVTWTYTSPIGRAQTGYRITLWSGSAEVYDSGFVPGAVTSAALDYQLVPFQAYRLHLGVSDGLDGAEDPVFFSPGWDYSDFTAEFSASDFDDQPQVGSIYEVGINGVGYMLGDHPDSQFRYQRQTVHLAPERLATGSTPFSEAVERYSFMAHSDWTSGTDQLYLDRANADPSRYSHSEWLNPFETGELSCLSAVEQNIPSTYLGNARATVAGGSVYLQTSGAGLTELDVPGGTPSAFSSGLAGVITSMTSDGTYWYATDGATIRRNNTDADPGANWSTDDVTVIEWVGDRIAGLDNVAAPAEFVHFSPAGVQTIEATYTGAVLRGLTGGDGYVWFGVNRGDTGVVNAWQLDSADDPFIALSLPAGESVDNLYFYLGNVFVASTTEDDRIRIYRCVPSEGRLTPQFLVGYDATLFAGQVDFAGLDRFVAFSWWSMNRDRESGIGVVDLESGGFARWYAAGGSDGFFGKQVTSVVRWAGDFAFVTLSAGAGEGGLFGKPEDDALHAGFLETSVSDLASNVAKVLDAVTLTSKPLAGTVNLDYSSNTNEAFTDIGTMSGTGVTQASFDVGASGLSFGFKLTLTPSGAEGPVVKLLAGKTHPLGLTDQVVVVPVDCTDERKGMNGMITPDSRKGRGTEIVRELEALCGSNVLFQDVDWPDFPSATYQVVSCECVERAGMYSRHEGKRKQHALLMVTLRKAQS